MLKTRHRERRLLRACVEALQPFVVDNTNPDQRRAAGLHPGRQGGRIPGHRLLLPIPSRGLPAAERAASGGSAGCPRRASSGRRAGWNSPRRARGSTNSTTSGSTRLAASWSRGGEMKIDDLDGRMRAFESALDPTVLPGVFMVARLDGRNFTRLTKELHPFETPFDRRFHDFMRRDGRAPDGRLRVRGRVRLHPERRDLPALRAGLGRLRAEAPQAALDPLGRGQRPILAAPRGDGRVRLPGLATPLGRVGRRLLPLAGRGRPPQRPERPLLLAPAEAGPGCRPGHRGVAGAVHLGQERVALPGRHQLQRPAVVAEAGLGAVLGGVRAARREPRHRRAGAWPGVGGSATTSNCR